MIIISATEFKAKCLDLMDRVRLTGERIQITKRGKVVAELGPPRLQALQKDVGLGFAQDWMTVSDSSMPIEQSDWEAESGKWEPEE